MCLASIRGNIPPLRPALSGAGLSESQGGDASVRSVVPCSGGGEVTPSRYSGARHDASFLAAPGVRLFSSQGLQPLDHPTGITAMATLSECRRRHDAADDFIRSIYTNKTAWSARQSALQQKIKCAYATLADDFEAYSAWESLLGRLRCATALVSIAPGVPALGPQAGNTFLDALLQCALRRADWIRPLDDWTPAADEPPSLQFQRLLRHLFCRYPVPEFFDRAWFEGFSEAGESHRAWFLLVGSGQNILFSFNHAATTEKMAH